MSEFIPALAVAGVPAILWVVLRYCPQAADALVVLLAGIVAVVSRDEKRRESCHQVLDKVKRRESRPPGRQRRRQVGRGRLPAGRRGARPGSGLRSSVADIGRFDS